MEIIDKAREIIKNKAFDQRGNSKSCYYVTIDGKEYALLVYKNSSKEKNDLRINVTNYLCNQGLKTPRVIGIDYDGDTTYELQERVVGDTFGYKSIERANGKENYLNRFYQSFAVLANADKKVFFDLMNNTRILRINGYEPDCYPDNYIIDNDGNITFVDIDIGREPEPRDDNLSCYINMLPWICSFFISESKIKNNGELQNIFKPLFESICYKWVEESIEFLKTLNIPSDEIKNIISKIDFHYFLIDKEQAKNIIDSFIPSNGLKNN